MRAFFDENGSPKVVIEIGGTTPGSLKTINALLDTGHNGSLSLPIIDLIEIGAPLKGTGEITYANGFKGIGYYFSVNVTIDGKTKPIAASMIENPSETEAIAGLELFSPYVAIIDFKNKAISFIDEEELRKLGSTQPKK